MKRRSLLSLLIVFLLVALAMTSCQMLNPREKFAMGLVNMILKPLDELQSEEYTKDLSGEMEELVNTMSHESAMTFELTDLSMPDSMSYFDIGMLNGAELDIDTQYDAESGDFLMDVNGLGLVKASMYMKENVLAVDVLGTMVAYEMESLLNYSKHIDLGDRFTDMQYSLNPSLAEMDTQTLDELRVIMEHYSLLMAENIDLKQISIGTEKIDVFGKSKRLTVVTVELNQDDLRDLTEILLEEARDDDRLKEFLSSYVESVNEMDPYTDYNASDFESEFEDSIDYALEDLDYMFEDVEVDLTFGLYFEPKFLFAKDEAPVALSFWADDGDIEVEAFYKFITDGREMDFSFTGDADGESVVYYVTNLKTRSGYTMEGAFEIPDMNVEVMIEGTTEIARNSELSEYTIELKEIEGVRGEVKIVTELIRIKKNSEYEMTAEMEGTITAEGESLSFGVAMEGVYDFAKSMEVEIPDLDDPDVTYVETLEDLEDVIYDIGF